MHRLTGDTETDSNVRDRRGVVQHLEHCLIALLHKPKLHQHDHDLPDNLTTLNIIIQEAQHQQPEPLGCNTATGATVAQEPGPRPETVSQQPGPQCPL
mgnify:CR=1 FL=1